MTLTETPDFAVDALLERGLGAHRAGDIATACQAYQVILAREPLHAGVIHLLGLARQAEGDLEEAERLVRIALRLRDDPIFHGNLAFILHKAGRDGEAEAEYEAALALDPSLVDVVRNHACFLRERQRHAEALAAFERLIALNPADGASHVERAIVLVALGRHTEAERTYRRALELAPDHPGALINLGSLLVSEVRNTEAEAVFRRAVAAHPGEPEAWGSLGLALANLDRRDEAEVCYRRALAIAPDHPITRINLSFVALGKGDFAEGWELFESRYDHGGGECLPPLLPGVRRWTGEPLAGRTLLVYGEQGFGDQLQFVRYAQMARRAGAARVIVAVAPELVRLFRLAPDLDEIIAIHPETPPVPADYWARMMTLPGLFGTEATTIAQATPPNFPQFHLPASPRPPPRPKAPLEVGLFWAGRAWSDRGDLKRVDTLRSLTFEQILPLLTAPSLKGKVRWTLLQRDRRPEGLPRFAEIEGWRDPFGSPEAAQPQDFLDTAHIMAGLDLVIGVDSALIHLAAGLGRPTWMMDRLAHCWRWVGDREDSDWYPTLRIFRQSRPEAWPEVVARVAAALRRGRLD
jgi:Flp pilus assembly protein TadD